MEALILIDGYNVIYKWRSMACYQGNVELARDRFLGMISNYQGYVGKEIKVVFDSSAKEGRDDLPGPKNIEVVFVARGITADTYIERLVYADNNPSRIMVITSDRLEKMMVAEKGAAVMSPEYFEQEVERVCQDGEQL